MTFAREPVASALAYWRALKEAQTVLVSWFPLLVQHYFVSQGACSCSIGIRAEHERGPDYASITISITNIMIVTVSIALLRCAGNLLLQPWLMG